MDGSNARLVAAAAGVAFAAGWAACAASHRATGAAAAKLSAPPPATAAAAPADAAAPAPAPAPAAAPPAAASAPAAAAAAPAEPPAGAQKAVRTAADVLAAEAAEEGGLVDGDVPPGVALKLVVLVRNDLAMSKGKIAAQCGHAVLGAYRVGLRVVPEYVKAWLFRAQAKITLKVDDEATMDAAAAAAREAGLPVCVIEDAGRTEVEPGTRTVCGIGPAPVAEIDAITGPKGKFALRLLT